MITRRERRDTYRLCNASFFRLCGEDARYLARLKIMFGYDYKAYQAMSLHNRINKRGEQYPQEQKQNYRWSLSERVRTLKFAIETHNLWLEKVANGMQAIRVHRYWVGGW